MLIPFCNMCKEECTQVTTRHFTSIGNFVGGHSAGIEVIPLTNGEFSSETHICDGCLRKLMSAALGEADPTLNKNIIDERESKLDEAEADIVNRQGRLKKDLDKLKVKEQELAKRNQEFVDELAKREERIKVLETQVATLSKREERIKVLEAQVATFQSDSAKAWKYVTTQATMRAAQRARGR